MKQSKRWKRTLILALLCISVLAPLVIVSRRLNNLTPIGGNDFVDDLSTIKYRNDDLRLKAIHQESVEGLKEPRSLVYKDTDPSFNVRDDIQDSKSYGIDVDKRRALESSRNETSNGSKTGEEKFQQNATSHSSGKKVQVIQILKDEHEQRSKSHEVIEEKTKETRNVQHHKEVRADRNVHSQSQRAADGTINEMKDQVIRARAYLNFAPPDSNSHLARELRMRIKEVERAVGGRTKDSDLPRSVSQKMRHMESSLTKASKVYPDCSLMASKLRAMTHTAEEQVRAQKKQTSYLVHLAARTTPKGLHCLSMRLTADYFSREPNQRQLPTEQKLRNLHDPKLFHYAIFSDNILASAVVINSVISNALNPDRTVFHLVTDSLNFPAISMWFLLNPPGKATIQVQSIDSFNWLLAKYRATQKQDFSDNRFSFQLNHLRFYLPDLFPKLNRVLLLDHDVVVQRDLTGLWDVDLKGKVIGVVETCQKADSSFRRMDSLINFSDPFVAERFNATACTWAFGVNVFDLKEWRQQKLTALYRRYLQMGSARHLWKAGSLPLGWVTFDNQTFALDRRWQVLGLGYDSDLIVRDIERAVVIHYDGIMKPWLDIAIGKYKSYWSKYVKYDHPYLQQCNIHN